jgi:hypothetical protein
MKPDILGVNLYYCNGKAADPQPLSLRPQHPVEQAILLFLKLGDIG